MSGASCKRLTDRFIVILAGFLDQRHLINLLILDYRMANTSTVGLDGVERGDLIKFYNTGNRPSNFTKVSY